MLHRVSLTQKRCIVSIDQRSMRCDNLNANFLYLALPVYHMTYFRELLIYFVCSLLELTIIII